MDRLSRLKATEFVGESGWKGLLAPARFARETEDLRS